MKAIVYKEYGPPEVLQLKEINKPTPRDNEVLVNVRAVSLNASDCEFLTGFPFYVRAWGPFKPKIKVLGSDIAGIVDSVGKNITEFKPGDEVLGDLFERWGGLAEFVCVPPEKLINKPKSISFTDASSLPQAAVVAYQGLHNVRKIQAGDKVLIIGAGGGSGTFAIQLAKLMGTEITAVDNNYKSELMSSLDADFVIDYQKEDCTKNKKQYDFILDLVGKKSPYKYKHILKPNGNYSMVGGSVPNIIKVLLLQLWTSIFGSQKMGMLLHKQNRTDMNHICRQVESGKIKPVIDKIFPIEQTMDAFQLLLEGKAKGKVVIKI